MRKLGFAQVNGKVCCMLLTGFKALYSTFPASHSCTALQNAAKKAQVSETIPTAIGIGFSTSACFLVFIYNDA